MYRTIAYLPTYANIYVNKVNIHNNTTNEWKLPHISRLLAMYLLTPDASIFRVYLLTFWSRL